MALTLAQFGLTVMTHKSIWLGFSKTQENDKGELFSSGKLPLHTFSLSAIWAHGNHISPSKHSTIFLGFFKVAVYVSSAHTSTIHLDIKSVETSHLLTVETH